MVNAYNTEGMPNDMPLEEWLWATGQRGTKGQEELEN